MGGKPRITASFRRRHWLATILPLDPFEPPLDDERPDWVWSKKRRAGDRVGEAREARGSAFLFGLATVMWSLVGLAVLLVPRQYAVFTYGLLLVFGVATCIWNYRKIGRLNVGYWSERIVGDYLNGLERSGARVIHDIETERGNIDHLVIAPSGVYAVETKGLVAPKRGPTPPVRIVRDRVTVEGRPLPRDPLHQATGSAAAASSLLREIGVKTWVRAVVLFPGRVVEGEPVHPDQAWAMAPKSFPEALSRQPQRVLTPSQIAKIYRDLRRICEPQLPTEAADL